VEKAWLARYTIAASIMTAAAAADDQPPYWYATVVGHRRCGADIAILHLRPKHPYPYAAGQYATLVSPRLPRVWRPYTMATAVGNQDLLEVHVRALGGGLSDVLVNATAPGDVLRLGPPQGTSTLRGAGGRSRLFVASGVGWAPTKALLDQLAQSAAAGPYPPPAHLVHIGPDGLLYDPDLARLPDRCPWLSTAYAHSCDDVIDCLPAAVQPAQLDTDISGAPDLVAWVGGAVAAAGVPSAQILDTSWPGA
jgi:ferredoxin-NADP reductase